MEIQPGLRPGAGDSEAIRQIETGNEQLSQLMDRLGRETRIRRPDDERDVSAEIGQGDVNDTPRPSSRAWTGGAAAPGLSADAARCVQPLFDELYAQQHDGRRQREVHVKLLQRLGLVDETSSPQAPQRADETDDVLFF